MTWGGLPSGNKLVFWVYAHQILLKTYGLENGNERRDQASLFFCRLNRHSSLSLLSYIQLLTILVSFPWT